ncbi:MAG: hypothetical protein ACYDHP_00350 [Ferrimicrobium sp.]
MTRNRHGGDHRPVTRTLHQLARLHGVELGYWDVYGRRHVASTETLSAVLRSLGVPLYHPQDAGELPESKRIESSRGVLEPVLVQEQGVRHRVSHSLDLPRDVDPHTVWIRQSGFEDFSARSFGELAGYGGVVPLAFSLDNLFWGAVDE